MSQRMDGHRRLGMPVMLSVAALLLAFAMVGGRWSTTAQIAPIASPVASPQAGECVGPTGEGGAGAAAGLMATPMVPGGLAFEATPVADDAAGDAIAAVENFVNCYNAGDLETVLALASDNLFQDKFGLASAADAAEALPTAELLPYTILEFGDVTTFDDGRVGVQLVYLAGDFHYVGARWIFTMVGEDLILDEEVLEEPRADGDSVVVGFSLTDDAGVMLPQATAVNSKPVVIMLGYNTSGEAAVANIFFLTDDEEPLAETVTDAATVPGDAVLVGQVSLAAGETASVTMVNAPVGQYAIVAGETVVILTINPPLEIDID